MTVSFKLDPRGKRVIGKMLDIEKLARRGVRQGAFRSGHGLIKRASDEILRKPKSGRTYFIISKAGSRRKHVASAPFETHANLSGQTRRSLSFSIKGTRELRFGYGVSASKFSQTKGHGRFLEFGTRNMDPRPSVQIAIREETSNMIQHFEDEIKKAIK